MEITRPGKVMDQVKKASFGILIFLRENSERKTWKFRKIRPKRSFAILISEKKQGWVPLQCFGEEIGEMNQEQLNRALATVNGLKNAMQRNQRHWSGWFFLVRVYTDQWSTSGIFQKSLQIP